MATMNKVIEYVDEIRINGYSDDHKYKWMSNLDGLIARDVMEIEIPCYDGPADADNELLVAAPFDDLYAMYVILQIELADQEYDHYNNMAMVFQNRLEQYKAWYLRKNRPPKRKAVLR